MVSDNGRGVIQTMGPLMGSWPAALLPSGDLSPEADLSRKSHDALCGLEQARDREEVQS